VVCRSRVYRDIYRRARVWPVGHVYTHICVGGSCVACRSCEHTHMCRRARVWSVGHGSTEIYVGELVCGLQMCKPTHISNKCEGGLVFSLSIICVWTHMYVDWCVIYYIHVCMWARV